MGVFTTCDTRIPKRSATFWIGPPLMPCFWIRGRRRVAGGEVVSRLARGVDQSSDPLKEAMRLAEIIDATASPALRQQMASIISGEFARCREAGDLRGTTLYGLLAAKLSVDVIAAPYL